MFFKQLINGVEYLHRKGVTHRDIKPENLLLMEDQKTLKISDFGLSTVFRHGGQERLLERRCGSLPYVAPEVLAGGQYCAEPGDVWSCGLVLVALLAGELPWARPASDLMEFRDWVDMKYTVSPWSKIGSLALSLLRKVVMPRPARHYTIGQIKDHLWTKKDFQDDEVRVQGGDRRKHIEQEPCFSLSQPLPCQGSAGDSAGWRGLSSNQPARLEALAGGGRVRRLTRLWAGGDRAAAERELPGARGLLLQGMSWRGPLPMCRWSPRGSSPPPPPTGAAAASSSRPPSSRWTGRCCWSSASPAGTDSSSSACSPGWRTASSRWRCRLTAVQHVFRFKFSVFLIPCP